MAVICCVVPLSEHAKKDVISAVENCRVMMV